MVKLEAMGSFLKAHRDAISPNAVGVPSVAARRVSGLRREEVAQLAGLSVDYYVRLEQGRATNPSAQVLDAVARVLDLDPSQRAHLDRLANPPRPSRARPHPKPRPDLEALIHQIPSVAAYLMSPVMDVTAGNDLAGRLFGFNPARPAHNIARAVFLDPSAHDYWADWSGVARDCVGYLRLSLGHDANDLALRDLIGDLSLASPEFVRLWAQQHVKQKSHGAKTIHHPLVGQINLHYETFVLPDPTRTALVMYTPTDDASADGLHLVSAST